MIPRRIGVARGGRGDLSWKEVCWGPRQRPINWRREVRRGVRGAATAAEISGEVGVCATWRCDVTRLGQPACVTGLGIGSWTVHSGLSPTSRPYREGAPGREEPPGPDRYLVPEQLGHRLRLSGNVGAAAASGRSGVQGVGRHDQRCSRGVRRRDPARSAKALRADGSADLDCRCRRGDHRPPPLRVDRRTLGTGRARARRRGRRLGDSGSIGGRRSLFSGCDRGEMAASLCWRRVEQRTFLVLRATGVTGTQVALRILVTHRAHLGTARPGGGRQGVQCCAWGPVGAPGCSLHRQRLVPCWTPVQHPAGEVEEGGNARRTNWATARRRVHGGDKH